MFFSSPYTDIMPTMLKIFTGRLFLVRMTLLLATLALVTAGIVTIYAAGNPAESTSGWANSGVSPSLWKKQVVFAMAGLFCIVAMNLFSYRWLGPLSYWIYALTLFMLALLLVGSVIHMPFTPRINGTYRWIRIGLGSNYIQIQPSEFCKITYILALAWYLRFRSNYRKFKGLIGPFALTLLAMVLILLEPDLGTVMLMMPILFAMLFVAGARVKHLLIIVALAMLAAPFLWQRMRPYQRMRISSVFLQNDWIYDRAMEKESLAKILAGSRQGLLEWKSTHGYHLMHSKYAIASGGITGNGLGRGPYIKYNYLAFRQNDFVFAIIAHQFGLIGCIILLSLYAIIIACGVEIAWQNTEPFGRLVAVGIISMLAIQIIVNVSMTLGLMPITGLTLPLVSYGGSSMIVSMIAVGLLNNIGRDRPFSIAKNPFEHHDN
jgi:cell division protein FtsW (lipid II flippase)